MIVTIRPAPMTAPNNETGGFSMERLKQRVSNEQRRQVLALRRRHSLREVAEATGLPLGTMKTLVSRSGAFRDNDVHRALFTLPSIKASAKALPGVLELPPQQTVTGDLDLDALLWLRSIINIGPSGPIATALEAAKKIKTPRKQLEERYQAYGMGISSGIPCSARRAAFCPERASRCSRYRSVGVLPRTSGV